MTQTTLEKFVDQSTIAKTLCLHNRTLRRLVVTGRFPAADLRLSKTCIRWRQSTVEAWLAENAGVSDER